MIIMGIVKKQGKRRGHSDQRMTTSLPTLMILEQLTNMESFLVKLSEI